MAPQMDGATRLGRVAMGLNAVSLAVTGNATLVSAVPYRVFF